MNRWDEFIEMAEEHFLSNLSVTSWYRSVSRNLAVHGVGSSKHLTGAAIDVVWDRIPPEGSLREFCHFHGVKLVRESDHDHFETEDAESTRTLIGEAATRKLI